MRAPLVRTTGGGPTGRDVHETPGSEGLRKSAAGCAGRDGRRFQRQRESCCRAETPSRRTAEAFAAPRSRRTSSGSPPDRRSSGMGQRTHCCELLVATSRCQEGRVEALEDRLRDSSERRHELRLVPHGLRALLHVHLQARDASAHVLVDLGCVGRRAGIGNRHSRGLRLWCTRQSKLPPIYTLWYRPSHYGQPPGVRLPRGFGKRGGFARLATQRAAVYGCGGSVT